MGRAGQRQGVELPDRSEHPGPKGSPCWVDIEPSRRWTWRVSRSTGAILRLYTAISPTAAAWSSCGGKLTGEIRILGAALSSQEGC